MSDPAEGILSYNGYQFSPRSHITVRSEIVYDDADRTTMYNRHVISVSEIVTPSSGQATTGDRMSDIRSRLSSAGKALIFRGKGFGIDLAVNVDPSGVRDVAFGPKPRISTWEPIGHNQAAMMTWECEVNLPCCEESLLAQGLASLNFDMAFAIDERGFTTRTVSGSWTIAMTRAGGNDRLIDKTADAFRNSINIDKPANFQRLSQNYQLSQDKRRMDFAIVDKEIEARNAWPAGVLNIQARHETSYSRRQMGKFPNTIQMRCALTIDQPASRAWEIFAALCTQRLARVLETQGSSAQSYIITEIEAVEDIYGNEFAFRLSYDMLRSNLNRFLVDSGIFLPTEETWDGYAAQADLVTTNRGIANLSHQPSMDRIVDLCDGTTPPNGGQGGGPPSYPPPTTFVVFRTPQPAPSASFWKFEATLDEITDHRSLNYSTLGKAKSTRLILIQ